ncbi:His Kinase A (phospho-acceptor) domain-containing protein [Shimia gijangensis]|uniref:histidine kinase n=1 Tax=Shimia gijangensis TaxID=1470563 RepID=A0A1M6APH1_9RHOB|nr:response regulator [Shimia gijangensis]SHI38355.1 His Kinase A (phospho-acceptor) domain-containing protein [Shimia gijangensis]
MTEASPTSFAEMLSGIRHDLRTPVGHIIGYSEMIEEELDEDEANTFAQDLQAIQNAGQRILALIDDHFNAAKTSPDQISLHDAQYQLRVQLNHISGYAEMLREEGVDDQNQELVSDLDKIIHAEKVIVSLVEKIDLNEKDSTEKSAKVSGPQTAPSNPAIEESALVGVGGHILVVDDDPVNREMLQRRLARSGYTSSVVASGQEALDTLAKSRADLVLLDLMMPGLSGLETLEILKADQRLRTVPVIMLTAADDMNTMVQCVLQGADDYIFKPFNPVLLNARISACLEKVRLRQNVSKKIRVFISSPGDVIPERKILKEVIGRLNEEFFGSAYIIPILWEEEPLLASDTFQAQIHPPHDTDVYVGILWSRIGSPLPDSILRPDGTRYDSGTAFEFEDALDGFRQNGKPEMLLYRKSGAPSLSLADEAAVLDRLDQIKKLQSYVDRWLIGEDGSYIGAFHMFAEIDEFEAMTEMHLRKVVDKLI